MLKQTKIDIFMDIVRTSVLNNEAEKCFENLKGDILKCKYPKEILLEIVKCRFENVAT